MGPVGDFLDQSMELGIPIFPVFFSANLVGEAVF